MSSSLRAAARGLGRRLGGAVQHQQRRNAGDLPVKPNKFVEANGYHRENVERDFRWNARSLTNIALAGVLFPYFIFKYSVSEFDHADEAAGRPPRDMLGSSK